MSFHVNSSAEGIFKRMAAAALQRRQEEVLWDSAARVVGEGQCWASDQPL
jgi:hypothetical protein